MYTNTAVYNFKQEVAALPCVPCREASYQAEGAAGAWASDSDSGWSDIELDDVAAVKFRAVTPPWQRGAERQQISVTLQQRTAAAAAATMGLEPHEYQAAAVAANWDEGLGGLGSCWEDDGDDTAAKLQEVGHDHAAWLLAQAVLPSKILQSIVATTVEGRAPRHF